MQTWWYIVPTSLHLPQSFSLLGLQVAPFFFRFPSSRPLLYHWLFTACVSVMQHLGGLTPFPSRKSTSSCVTSAKSSRSSVPALGIPMLCPQCERVLFFPGAEDGSAKLFLVHSLRMPSWIFAYCRKAAFPAVKAEGCRMKQPSCWEHPRAGDNIPALPTVPSPIAIIFSLRVSFSKPARKRSCW